MTRKQFFLHKNRFGNPTRTAMGRRKKMSCQEILHNLSITVDKAIFGPAPWSISRSATSSGVRLAQALLQSLVAYRCPALLFLGFRAFGNGNDGSRAPRS